MNYILKSQDKGIQRSHVPKIRKCTCIAEKNVNNTT